MRGLDDTPSSSLASLRYRICAEAGGVSLLVHGRPVGADVNSLRARRQRLTSAADHGTNDTSGPGASP
jgi:hypothetical protein